VAAFDVPPNDAWNQLIAFLNGWRPFLVKENIGEVAPQKELNVVASVKVVISAN